MSDPLWEINLLNVSGMQLRGLAKRAGVDGLPPNAPKLDVVRRLVKELRPDQLDSLASSYMFAGQTAMSWVRLGSDPLDVEELRKAIVTVSGGNPFASSLRPKVTSTPNVVEATVRDDGKIVVTFVIAKSLRPITQNFQVVPLHEDHFFVAVIRPELAIVEIRSSSDRAQRVTNTFVAQVAELLGVEPTPVGISTTELAQFRGALGAKLSRYRGKEQEGSDIDIRDLKKSEECADLAEVAQFKTETGSCTPIHETWQFDYQDDEVSVQVSRQGSVWFRSSATEEIIDHVFSELRKVKGF